MVTLYVLNTKVLESEAHSLIWTMPEPTVIKGLFIKGEEV